jgi:hypothetical protein
MGFAPFELLYGRTVRGPVDILKELWTQDGVEPEVKTTYEYVVDLRNRLKETCELAQVELRKAQEKQKSYYNRKAVQREFKVGSRVLILRPNNYNKLLMQWQGPYVVTERVRGSDYHIDLNGKSRLYHANMLTQYFERNDPNLEEHTVGEDMQYETVGAAILEPEDQEEIELPLLEPGQKETYKDVDVNPELDETRSKEIWNLLEEYQDIFSDKPNKTTLGTHEIKLTSTEPIQAKLYPIPHALRNILSEEIDSMLKLKVIEPSIAQALAHHSK